MGISTHVYGYWGIKLPWNASLYEAFEEYLEDDRGSQLPGHVFDAMGASYQILGIKLYGSGDFRWGMENGDGCRKIDVSEFPHLEAQYKHDFMTMFPQFADLMKSQFDLIMFTHYS
jgi:hypothetical protein